jgi:hypothetical protein
MSVIIIYRMAKAVYRGEGVTRGLPAAHPMMRCRTALFNKEMVMPTSKGAVH